MIKNLIAQNRILDAINAIGDKDASTMLSAKWHILQQRIEKGIVAQSDARLEQDRIIEAVRYFGKFENETNKQSRFNIPGGGWITLEQDGDRLITQAEGNAAGLLVAQIAKRGMSYSEAVSYCKMCLMPEKEIIQETIRQQRDFANWCAAQIALIGTRNIQARNEYEALTANTEWEIRLLQRRLKRIK